MKRLVEILLGLDKGFLSKDGEFSLQFNPKWPLQDAVGAVTWNLAIGILAGLLVIYVYRREGRSRFARVLLGVMRAMLLAFVLALLNRPVINLSQSRQEPSVLAIAIDDSISMRVKDGPVGLDGKGTARLEAVLNLLTGENQKLIKELARKHEVRFYRFSRAAEALSVPVALDTGPASPDSAGPTTAPSPLANALTSLKADGQNTQILASLRGVMENLQGQQVAGIVLLTDGRDTPLESQADLLPTIQKFGIRVYPIAVGSEKPPQNLTVESVNVQEAAFVKDIVNVRAQIRGVGYPRGHEAIVTLKNKAGQPLLRSDGRPAQETVTLAGDGSQEVEINFKPAEVGTLDMVVEVVKQPGEIDEEDNVFPAQIAVLDAKISLLYVEGYPRWEYRYLKNEMIRDQTVDISCLLFSADTGFAQEGNKPITRFPESMTEMLAYDVVLFGDIDPRQFTDAQLQLINDFVAKKGGGFGMVSGPRWAPYSFRNTAIEPILPVSISRVLPPDAGNIAVGWRPVLTREGAASTIFRFFEKKDLNEKFLKEDIQPLFWYCKGVTLKPGAGEVYAEHPNETGPDGRKSPVLVLGRYGAGRTLFSAIDDSWRWRFYTGESVFDTYWIQQLRYLARSKKLGQRRFTLTSLRPAYELGEQIQVSVRVLDPELLPQLPEQIGVTIEDSKGQTIRKELMQRQEGQIDLFVASWTADAVGHFVLKMPSLGGNTQPAEQPIVVKIPRLELIDPAMDRSVISKLAEKAGEKDDLSARPDLAKLNLAAPGDYDIVRSELLKIPSAAKIIPNDTNEPLWNAPLAMAIFVLLITLEWVLRKVYGML